MYLGIDLGTSGVTALLIDETQQVMASAEAALAVSRPSPGWSEQDPSSWISATRNVIGQLHREHPRLIGATRAIGLSGQMHGATLLDSSDAVLRPSILWNDTRSHREAAELDANPLFRELTGNIVFPGFTAPKLCWVRNNEADLFKKVAKVLLPKDYLRLWLTGGHVSDMSDASGTSWLDVSGRRWSSRLLEATNLTADNMPDLVEGSAVSGQLRSELAAEWGMPDTVVVAGGGGDNAASAVGTGVVGAGSAFVSLGTSGVLFAANESYRPDPDSAVHTFCHAVPGAWHQMGVILSATDALNWHASIVGSSATDLTNEIDGPLAPPSGIVFLPYLSGERTPHNDAAIRGAFVGLDRSHDRRAVTRAVLEGVSFALRDSLEALRGTGTELSSVTAVGGGSRSPYWLRLLATVLGIPVELPGEGDFSAAFGAARLGLIAACEKSPLDICIPPAIERVYEPETTLRDAFEAAYSRYRAIYPAIKGVS